MDFRLLVFSRTHFSPSLLEPPSLPRLAEHRARSGRRCRPEGKQPFFSTPSSIYIERLKAFPPAIPPALLCHLSPFYSLRRPLRIIEQCPSSSLSTYLFLSLVLLFSLCHIPRTIPCFISRICDIGIVTFKYSFRGSWKFMVVTMSKSLHLIFSLSLYQSLSSFFLKFFPLYVCSAFGSRPASFYVFSMLSASSTTVSSFISLRPFRFILRKRPLLPCRRYLHYVTRISKYS